MIVVAVLIVGTTLTNALLSDSNPIVYIASSLGLQTTSADTLTRPKSPLDPHLLEIPSLGIKANVQYIGVKANGQLSTPSNFTSVGWYKDGPAPGEKGTSVIDGHVDNGLALAGVFKHLTDMKVGDSIYVVNNAGKKFKFIVTDVKLYSYKDTSENNVFVAADKIPHLNLITCTGDWVAHDKTYNQRLVVYTDLVG